MAETISQPYIPAYITVHLGAPDAPAARRDHGKEAGHGHARGDRRGLLRAHRPLRERRVLEDDAPPHAADRHERHLRRPGHAEHAQNGQSNQFRFHDSP